MDFGDSRRLNVRRVPLLNGTTQNAGAVNYNAANARFSYTPDGAAVKLLGFMMVIEDEDSDYNKFGNVSALSNGLQLLIEETDNDVVFDVLNGGKITSVQTAFRQGASVEPLNDSSGATRSTQIFLPIFSQSVVQQGQRFSVLLKDDLSAVAGLYFWLYFENLGGLSR